MVRVRQRRGSPVRGRSLQRWAPPFGRLPGKVPLIRIGHPALWDGCACCLAGWFRSTTAGNDRAARAGWRTARGDARLLLAASFCASGCPQQIAEPATPQRASGNDPVVAAVVGDAYQPFSDGDALEQSLRGWTTTIAGLRRIEVTKPDLDPALWVACCSDTEAVAIADIPYHPAEAAARRRQRRATGVGDGRGGGGHQEASAEQARDGASIRSTCLRTNLAHRNISHWTCRSGGCACGYFELGYPIRADGVHGLTEFFHSFAKPGQFILCNLVMF